MKHECLARVTFPDGTAKIGMLSCAKLLLLKATGHICSSLLHSFLRCPPLLYTFFSRPRPHTHTHTHKQALGQRAGPELKAALKKLAVEFREFISTSSYGSQPGLGVMRPSTIVVLELCSCCCNVIIYIVPTTGRATTST